MPNVFNHDLKFETMIISSYVQHIHWSYHDIKSHLYDGEASTIFICETLLPYVDYKLYEAYPILQI